MTAHGRARSPVCSDDLLVTAAVMTATLPHSLENTGLCSHLPPLEKALARKCPDNTATETRRPEEGREVIPMVLVMYQIVVTK